VSAEELIEIGLPQLRLLNPAFDPSWITDRWLFAAPNAQPVVDKAYRAAIPGFETGMRDLYLATMFQVYPHDRGQNYSIELAERLVTWLESAPSGAPQTA
jgi:hypothetical protein